MGFGKVEAGINDTRVEEIVNIATDYGVSPRYPLPVEQLNLAKRGEIAAQRLARNGTISQDDADEVSDTLLRSVLGRLGILK